jgi:hypothetical protein
MQVQDPDSNEGYVKKYVDSSEELEPHTPWSYPSIAPALASHMKVFLHKKTTYLWPGGKRQSLGEAVYGRSERHDRQF